MNIVNISAHMTFCMEVPYQSSMDRYIHNIIMLLDSCFYIDIVLCSSFIFLNHALTRDAHVILFFYSQIPFSFPISLLLFTYYSFIISTKTIIQPLQRLIASST